MSNKTSLLTTIAHYIADIVSLYLLFNVFKEDKGDKMYTKQTLLWQGRHSKKAIIYDHDDVIK